MQPNIHDAVRAVYSNVVTISGNDVNSLICLDQSGVEVTIVPATVEAKLTELQNAYTAEQTAQANAKASALAKLTALGLTQDEVKAIVG
jgi:hypothetical protein